MSYLDVLFLGELYTVVVIAMTILNLFLNFLILVHHYLIILYYWLGEYTNYWYICFGSDMVPSANHFGFG